MGTSTGSNDSSESNDKPGENTETSPEADSRTRPDDDGCETSTTTGPTASTTTDGSGTTDPYRWVPLDVSQNQTFGICSGCGSVIHLQTWDLHRNWHVASILGFG